MPDYSIIGQSLPRIDGVEKVTGAARYAADLRFDRMLHAGLIRSPHAHARVAAIHVDDALALPGVKAAASILEVPRMTKYWFFLRDEKKRQQMLLLDDRVRFVGDPVLALAATDEKTLAQALCLVKVDYEILKPMPDPQTALTETGTQIHKEGNIAFQVKKDFGDVEKGFSDCDVIVETTYRTSKQKHACLEPIGTAVAHFTAAGRLTVFSSTQLPHWSRHYLAAALNLPLNRVRVIKPFTGGAFGGRCGLIHGLELMCAHLSRKTLMPVRISFSRNEDFFATESRHPMTIRMKTGATRDGKILANEVEILSDTGAYGTHYIGVLADCLSTGVGLYRIPNYRFSGTAVYTNTSLAGALRGYGNPQMNFAQESQMDRMAEQLGMDPVALRLKNIRRAGEIDPVLGEKILSNGLEACLEKGAAAAGWPKKRIRGKKRSPIRQGLGLSVMLHGTGAARALPDPASATVMINADGTAGLMTAAADEGQGSRTVLAQVAAQILGIDFNHITVSDTDTEVTPLDCGTHGSRQAYCGGLSVRDAALDARKKLLAHAAAVLKTDPGRLTIEKGVVFQADRPQNAVMIRDLMQRIQISDMGICTQIIGTASGIAPAMPGYYGAVFAMVEVNVRTGLIRVKKLVSAFDVGKAINPEIVKGQIAGGGVMGVGFALSEGLILDQGRIMNPGFCDYRIPRTLDAPAIEVILVESNEPTGPFGAKGIGEGAMVNVASAVANAVYDACGVRMTILPMSAQDLLNGLKAKKNV